MKGGCFVVFGFDLRLDFDLVDFGFVFPFFDKDDELGATGIENKRNRFNVP